MIVFSFINLSLKKYNDNEKKYRITDFMHFKWLFLKVKKEIYGSTLIKDMDLTIHMP